MSTGGFPPAFVPAHLAGGPGETETWACRQLTLSHLVVVGMAQDDPTLRLAMSCMDCRLAGCDPGPRIPLQDEDEGRKKPRVELRARREYAGHKATSLLVQFLVRKTGRRQNSDGLVTLQLLAVFSAAAGTGY